MKWWKVGGFGGVRTDEVFPKNATVYTINGLSPVTEFGFSVAGKNLLGEGNYTTDIVRQETSSMIMLILFTYGNTAMLYFMNNCFM